MEPKKFTPEIKETIVEMLGHMPNVTTVCRLLGLSATHCYRLMKTDEEFGAAVREAMEVGYDGLEEEAHRRAVIGVNRPIFFQGEQCGEVREYSDSLLKELLRAYRPKKFNPAAKVDVGVGEKVSLQINIGG